MGNTLYNLFISKNNLLLTTDSNIGVLYSLINTGRIFKNVFHHCECNVHISSGVYSLLSFDTDTGGNRHPQLSEIGMS